MKSPVYNFTTALAAGDQTPHKFIVYGDMGIDPLLSPDGQRTADRLVEEYRDNNIQHVFHHGDISYAVGFVSIFCKHITLSLEDYYTMFFPECSNFDVNCQSFKAASPLTYSQAIGIEGFVTSVQLSLLC